MSLLSCENKCETCKNLDNLDEYINKGNQK